ncbi:hypothetical protein QZH56_06085 [Streptomyces olivoreticuli]|uniref:hypothetical protein n=1 Tax=Streptomyces olivoreticuli TaxID=68246 RepID=UPI0026595B90|nr:hypothetical protein [Streptomyces olivoreticuli]WKK25183.1 hypothetical protein QZH56_06085 [Streptomyces olivoreticuli]
MIVTEQNTPKKRSCVPVADLRIHGDAVRAKMNAARDDVGMFAKFAPPTVAAGKVYVPTFSGALHAYGPLG